LSAPATILSAVGRRDLDTFGLAGLWVAGLAGAVAIAAIGADIVALAVLWLVVLAGAVLLAASGGGDHGVPEGVSVADVFALVVGALLLLVYVTAASVALGAGLLATFFGSVTLGIVFVVVWHERVLRVRWRGADGGHATAAVDGWSTNVSEDPARPARAQRARLPA